MKFPAVPGTGDRQRGALPGDRAGTGRVMGNRRRLIEEPPPCPCPRTRLKTAPWPALDYFPELKERDLPRYVLVSDFARFRLYDLDESQAHEFPRSYWIARRSETRSGVYPDHRALVEPTRLTDL